MSESVYPMRVVVERTGLTSHLIRAWERRYGAVVPHRTETNRRLYSDADIHRLRLLRSAVEGGHAISRVAALSDRELEPLASSARPKQARAVNERRPESLSVGEHIQLALEASVALDAEGLEEVLTRAEMDLGRYTLIDRVIDGLLVKIGELWRRGEMRPSQEHLTSNVVRQILGQALTFRKNSQSAPAILLATPSGHLHELGCLMAANAVEMQGWRTIYLGANLPAEEIAQAARQTGVRIVGLSLVYPSRNPQTVAELTRLRRLLPEDTTLMIGGRAGRTYSDIDLRGAVFVNDLEEMQRALEELL